MSDPHPAVPAPLPAWKITDETSPLDAALALAHAGFRVAWIHAPDGAGCTCGKPKCAGRGKHPILSAWQRLASADADVLRDQFHRISVDVPNLGVVLGDGLVAIDVDDADRLAELIAEYGPLPATLTGRSPRGARLFFRTDTPARNATAIGGKPGVDAKSTGGQVVVGPSMHPSGKRYTWDYPLAAVADLPAGWALALMPTPKPPETAKQFTPSSLRDNARARKNHETYLDRAVTAQSRLIARTVEGARNTLLHRSAVSLFALANGLHLPGGFSYVRAELERAGEAAGLSAAESRRAVSGAEEWVVREHAVRMPRELPPLDRQRSSPAPLVPASGESPPSAEGPLESDASPPPHCIGLLDDNGSPAKNAGNVARMLAAYPGGPPRLDEFFDRVTWPSGAALTDADALRVQDWLLEQPAASRVRASVEAVHGGLLLAATERKFHPVRDYLHALDWDKTPRVERLFSSYFGATHSAYVAGASRCFLVGAVARVMRPGCKLDTMPVLEGAQGIGKSTGLSVLAGENWFSDSFIPTKEPDCYQVLRGVWIYELSELASIRSRDAERMKAYLSSRSDRFRASYARIATDVPRQVAFAGTTNARAYLSDDSGHRRFHPIACGDIDLVALARDRDQLWAEAVSLCSGGVPWHLAGEVADQQAGAAAEREHEDPWAGLVSGLPAEVGPMQMHEALVLLGVELGRQTRADEMRLSALLRRSGWERSRVRRGEIRRYEWAKVRAG